MSTEGSLGVSSLRLGRRLRVDNGTMGTWGAVENAVRGRDEREAGSAGRLRSRLTSNFWDAVELAGEEGVSATVKGRRGDVQLGVVVGADNMGGDSSWLGRAGILIRLVEIDDGRQAAACI